MAGAVLGVAPQAAAADSLSAAVQSSAPEQGVPLTLNFTGSGAAIDSYGDGPYLYAVIRPSGGIACQPSYGSDLAAAGTGSTITGDDFSNGTEVGPGTFSQPITYNPPNAASYLVCAWLESTSNDDPGNPAPSTDVSAATSVSFTARPPQVSELEIGLGSPALPGVGFQIDYTTHTDQQLTLNSVVKPAGGLPCASSYELELQQNQNETDVFEGGTSVFGGPITTQGSDEEQYAGPYLVCAWIEGPTTGEVDAATSQSIYVGTPPAAPRPKPSRPKARPDLRISRVTASRHHGVHVRGTTARHLTGRVIVGVTCGAGTSFAKSSVRDGRFAGHVTLPYTCRHDHTARVRVTWHGSAKFGSGSVLKIVTIRR